MRTEGIRVGLGQRDLTGCGRRLTFLQLQRPTRQPENTAAKRNRSGGDKQHLRTGIAQLDHIGDQRVEPATLEFALLDKQGGADLDNDAAEVSQTAGHQGCQPSCSGAGTWLASSSLSLSIARTIMRSARSTLRPLAEDRISGF